MRRGRRGTTWWTGLVLGLTLCAGSAVAGGGQHYPNGAEDFVVGALPPPGVYFKNYLVYINKDRLMDNEGKKTPVEFDASVFAAIPRFIWVSPYKILGASWGAHVFIPFYTADVEVTAQTPGGPLKVVNDSDGGLGDIIFSPFILGWHFGPNFHAVFAVDVWAPTGNYDNDDVSTQLLSRNHWTFEPVFAATYLWNGFDFSVKLMYDFNTTNDEYLVSDGAGGMKEVDLDPGQEFHFDWAVGWSPKPGWRFGVNGFYYWQTTDDEIDGTENSDRSRLAAIGPGLKWWPNQGRFSVVAKHLWEFDGKNMPEGSSTWLNVVWVF